MTRRTLQPRLHNPLASLLLLAWCLLSPDASAQSEPEQVEDPLFKMQKFDRELGLSADQLRRRSVATRVANFALNAVNFASIPVGMLPLPTISFAAEIAGTTTDNTLKFARPYLVAPPDVARSANSACYFQFDLPQTMTKYEDVLGLYRTLGGVRIRAPGNQTPVSFGVLGTPDVVHLNTDVRLSVHESLRLVSDRSGDDRVTVSGRGDGDPSGEVEVPLAGGGGDPGPLPGGDLEVGDLEPHMRQVVGTHLAIIA